MSSNEATPNKYGDQKISSDIYKYSRDGDIISLQFHPHTLIVFPLNDFRRYSDLTYLSLPNNGLKKISEDIFYSFPNLTWFDVRENKIQEFPNFVGHENLETILVGGNKIEKLPIELGSFGKLACLQVSGNPLTFPDLKILEKNDYDLVSFLQLCWQNQTKNPVMKIKPVNKGKQKTAQLKKRASTGPVKCFGNIANVVASKMNSKDPLDQLLASRVLKKMRAIESQLQKNKDHQTLKEWREKYMSKGAAICVPSSVAPFDLDPDFMNMMNRSDLNKCGSKQLKKITKKPMKKPININEELLSLDKQLDGIKQRKICSDPAIEKAQRLDDIQKMNQIQKKIKELQIVNFKNSA